MPYLSLFSARWLPTKQLFHFLALVFYDMFLFPPCIWSVFCFLFSAERSLHRQSFVLSQNTVKFFFYWSCVRYWNITLMFIYFSHMPPLYTRVVRLRLTLSYDSHWEIHNFITFQYKKIKQCKVFNLRDNKQFHWDETGCVFKTESFITELTSSLDKRVYKTL
jgi:hypothetical protein